MGCALNMPWWCCRQLGSQTLAKKHLYSGRGSRLLHFNQMEIFSTSVISSGLQLEAREDTHKRWATLKGGSSCCKCEVNARSKWQVNARLAAPGNKRQTSSREREPTELWPGRLPEGGRNCPGLHIKYKSRQAQGKEETYLEFFEKVKKSI